MFGVACIPNDTVIPEDIAGILDRDLSAVEQSVEVLMQRSLIRRSETPGTIAVHPVIRQFGYVSVVGICCCRGRWVGVERWVGEYGAL